MFALFSQYVTQHLYNIKTKSKSIRMSLEVLYHMCFMPEIFTTWTTAKMFDALVCQKMSSQSICCTETHWTFTANIRLHTFMTKYMFLKATTTAEFLLTNVTREPSTFIVWLQQMCCKLAMPRKTVWTVSTWVWLCTSVNFNVLLESSFTFKPLLTVTTVIRSSVAMYIAFMSLQTARCAKTFVTQWTLVRFVSRVDCHVSV